MKGKDTMKGYKTKKCCICGYKITPQIDFAGRPYWFDGHNAQPVKNGRCCDTCNELEVIPARIMRAFSPKKLA